MEAKVGGDSRLVLPTFQPPGRDSGSIAVLSGLLRLKRAWLHSHGGRHGRRMSLSGELRVGLTNELKTRPLCRKFRMSLVEKSVSSRLLSTNSFLRGVEWRGESLDAHKQILRVLKEAGREGEREREREVRGRGWRWSPLTLFNILWTAGESGVYRIFPISRGLTEFHTIFVTGLDSRVCMRALQKGAVAGSSLWMKIMWRDEQPLNRAMLMSELLFTIEGQHPGASALRVSTEEARHAGHQLSEGGGTPGSEQGGRHPEELLRAVPLHQLWRRHTE
ncbi:hypothetical protein INR49_013160, partial [Caranx melampygus]